MTTITISKEAMKEGFVVLPRREYQELLKHKTINEEHESLWQAGSQDKLLKSYHKSDAIYDKI